MKPKKKSLYIFVFCMCLPLVTCSSVTIPTDVLYSMSGWDYVTYFKIDEDNDVTFGSKVLGPVEHYHLNRFSSRLKDEDGDVVGKMRRNLFGVKVTLYEDFYEQFNGTYFID